MQYFLPLKAHPVLVKSTPAFQKEVLKHHNTKFVVGGVGVVKSSHYNVDDLGQRTGARFSKCVELATLGVTLGIGGSESWFVADPSTGNWQSRGGKTLTVLSALRISLLKPGRPVVSDASLDDPEVSVQYYQ